MIDRKRYDFTPDYRNIVAAARNQTAPRLPLYEHMIGCKVVREIMGNSNFELCFSGDMNESREGFRAYWAFCREMGFDVVPIEFNLTGVLEGGGALISEKGGCIKTREDLERYPWEDVPRRYFDRYAPYIRNMIETCPKDMRAIGGVGNGPFEIVQDLVGYMDLCLMKGDEDEKLFDDVFAAMGRAYTAIWEQFIREYGDVYCVFRFGDDLGFNTQTLISPADIRRNLVPIYRRVTDMVHSTGKPFLLHSCGCIFDVMDDLIDGAKIDAKHSNEDLIAPFTHWVERYGDRIGNFGGIDTGVLCLEKPEEIRRQVFAILDEVKGRGGIAFSSGNSIPDYVPTEGYLAMIEAVRDWRGDKLL